MRGNTINELFLKVFESGDKVIVFEKDSTNKLWSQWTGPCELGHPVSDNSYLVLLPSGSQRIFHLNHLKKFTSAEQLVGLGNNHVVKMVKDNLDGSVHAKLNLVGVIHEEDTADFGEVIELPITDSVSTVDFESVVSENCAHLSDSQQRQLCDILRKHKHVFSDKPGFCKIGEHSIRVKESVPIPRKKLYPVPIVMREEVDRQVNELLAADIIEHSNSPYAHPIVCVRKKDNSIRLAVDYRAVNSISIPDRFPSVNANELLMEVGKANYITSLDATQGFFQISLADDGSRERSASATHTGLYNFKRMSFGLMNASCTYQRIMNQILEPDRKYDNSFIDDVAVHSVTWDDHLQHLDSVLQRIGDSGLTLKLSKCKFAQPRIQFLGHVVGGGTHTPDPEKLQAVSKMLFPKTKRQMKSLIGLISYYRLYVPNLADIARCLTDMTKRSHPTVLSPGDEEHPIAYASSKLNGAQLNWSTVEKEGYAIIHALKKFDSFVYGRELHIVTD